MDNANKKDTVSKSWFCVFNNPEERGYTGTPEEIVDRLKDEWTDGHPTRTGAWIYCISADGLKHVHMVLEDTKAMRFSVIKKSYANGMHFEPTKGTKEQAEEYINKRGRFEEKGEKILATARYGEIKGAQGQRKDLEIIQQLIEQGYTPTQIYDEDIRFRKNEKIIKGAYYRKRVKETPYEREVVCYWHVGQSGTGKSYVASKIVAERGEEVLYRISDYSNGCFDYYEAQPILFLDEFRGLWKYSFLLSVLDKYKTQFYARYENIIGLWNEVHITSVKTPDMIYEKMINEEDRRIDTFEQLRRRIDYIVYHWKDEFGYHEYKIPMERYVDYETLVFEALQNAFKPVGTEFKTPFDMEIYNDDTTDL